MIYGFLFTALALVFVILLALVEIHRIDKVIEKIDSRRGRSAKKDKR
jgi:hypothetical protein